MFRRVCIVGIGLIGSSLARGLTEGGLAERIVVADEDPGHRARALELGLCAEAHADPAQAARGAELVILCVPIGANAAVARTLGPSLAPGTIVTDVGSVKAAVIEALAPHCPPGVHLVPGHPIAGTEKSGPDAGFASLFRNRWCVLTPPPGTDPAAVARVRALWEALGSRVEEMEPGHHDRVLAITSHLPHLIAYTIVGTATDLEGALRSEVIKFSASGFRDFTRIAASDPTMWRDIFLNNREAVLEIIQRFTEDLTALQRAIRWGDGETLFAHFAKTRDVRRGVVEANQAGTAPWQEPGVPSAEPLLTKTSQAG